MKDESSSISMTGGRGPASGILDRLEEFSPKGRVTSVGTVTEVRESIVRIAGLADVGYNELVGFADGPGGLVLGLEENSALAIVLGTTTGIKEGDEVEAQGRLVHVPVGDGLIGRVVDALGRPRDERGSLRSESMRPIEWMAPDVTKRRPVDVPLRTGLKAVDSMIPIGRGQRELILGDRATGKSTVALDAIVAQKDSDVLCVYVAIGQRTFRVAQVVETLQEHGAMDYSVIVAADASDPAALQYLAPYAACAIAEHFMYEGKDVLVVYDDLSKHAWAYRQLSLLLRRPPGREAYPGDIFYLHSRLLERAARLSTEMGGGSLTALPIIETHAGDVSAYIPTNVISITDGQIYLDADLFNAGTRPAINLGLSVSRVGSSAQTKAMKDVAGMLRLELAQYRELEAFTRFGAADLDRTSRSRVERGKRLTEVLKQPPHTPMSLGDQIAILYAVTRGYLDDVAVSEVASWAGEFGRFLSALDPDPRELIETASEVTSEIESALQTAISRFKGVAFRGGKDE
jgi:F-type H+-transporting ATPase subunit alpha